MTNPIWFDDFNKPLATSKRVVTPALRNRQKQGARVRREGQSRRDERRAAIEPVKSVRYRVGDSDES